MTSQHDIKQILENLYDGLYLVDRDRRITYWNKAAERITGYKADEVIGSLCADNILIHVDANGKQLCRGMCPLGQTISDGRPREAEIFLHHRRGHRVHVSVRVTPMKNDHGEIVGGIELFTDISSRTALLLQIEELKKLALIDPLTNLPNRRHFESQVAARFAEMKRYGLPFGLLIIDVDHFKQFNDKHGHDVGDLVLQSVANTFLCCIRPFDDICRWGGEEFAGIFPNIGLTTLKEVAERLRALVQHSQVHRDDELLSVTVSIGGSMAEQDDTMASLVKRADSLMYVSKKNGRNRVTIDELANQ